MDFRLRTVEVSACASVHVCLRIGFLPDVPVRIYWLMPPQMYVAYGNYDYMLKIQSRDGVIRRVLVYK